MVHDYRAAARQRKATAITETLTRAVQRFLAYLQLSTEDWTRAAGLAGCRPPSEETRAVVLERAACQAILDAAAASLERDDAHGTFEALAVGANVVSVGLDPEQRRIVDRAHDDLVRQQRLSAGRAA